MHLAYGARSEPEPGSLLHPRRRQPEKEGITCQKRKRGCTEEASLAILYCQLFGGREQDAKRFN